MFTASSRHLLRPPISKTFLISPKEYFKNYIQSSSLDCIQSAKISLTNIPSMPDNKCKIKLIGVPPSHLNNPKPLVFEQLLRFPASAIFIQQDPFHYLQIVRSLTKQYAREKNLLIYNQHIHRRRPYF